MSNADRERGFTLVELLVAMVIISFMSLTMLAFFLATSRFRRDGEILVESDQGLRAAVDVLARDIRLAGVCLPTQGNFIPLTATNNGSLDTLTVRSGFVEGNEVCVRTTIREDMPQNSRELKVEGTDGFEEKMMLYLVHPDGAGEYITITQVQSAARMLQHDIGLTRDYPAGSGVYSLQEKVYAIDPITFGGPVLTVAVDRKAPQALAHGIEALEIQYRLKRNCPPCDTVVLPTDDAEWRLVTELLVTTTVASRRALASGDAYRQTSTVIVKPRNLLP